MIKYETEKIEQKYVTSIVCDICKKEINVLKDRMEAQEIHHIEFVGGFGSVFGDGVKITCDICQHCLKEKLGKYLVRDGEQK